jgi:DNA-binding NtrC family response regulator
MISNDNYFGMFCVDITLVIKSLTMYRIVTLTCEQDFVHELEGYLKSNTSIEINNFSNSLDLIDFCLKKYAQVCILDIDLLQQDIIKLIEVIHSIHQETQIILLVSEENTNICPEAFSRGVSSYQIKPISAKNFIRIIESTLSISY